MHDCQHLELISFIFLLFFYFFKVVGDERSAASGVDQRVLSVRRRLQAAASTDLKLIIAITKPHTPSKACHSAN
jgi:hypothetical protein